MRSLRSFMIRIGRRPMLTSTSAAIVTITNSFGLVMRLRWIESCSELSHAACTRSSLPSLWSSRPVWFGMMLSSTLVELTLSGSDDRRTLLMLSLDAPVHENVGDSGEPSVIDTRRCRPWRHMNTPADSSRSRPMIGSTFTGRYSPEASSSLISNHVSTSSSWSNGELAGVSSTLPGMPALPSVLSAVARAVASATSTVVDERGIGHAAGDSGVGIAAAVSAVRNAIDSVPDDGVEGDGGGNSDGLVGGRTSGEANVTGAGGCERPGRGDKACMYPMTSIGMAPRSKCVISCGVTTARTKLVWLNANGRPLRSVGKTSPWSFRKRNWHMTSLYLSPLSSSSALSIVTANSSVSPTLTPSGAAASWSACAPDPPGRLMRGTASESSDVAVSVVTDSWSSRSMVSRELDRAASLALSNCSVGAPLPAASATPSERSVTVTCPRMSPLSETIARRCVSVSRYSSGRRYM
eukprot:Unigene1515_Nuclearia_a/m.4723 Unigene1515_Nuclearia_a/g.4723  ORF Unigene1515_Nuclearia_a/g.4723 Unigene1515_Nuclearia_a/m.4723 type:complete len:466 (+) Unigene1515_Nuclearia_a:1009-2406(+)